MSKIFTSRFYITNTGFFLLLFYLLFGVVEGGQLLQYHVGLMKGFLQHRGFLLVVLGLWLLYNGKCLYFILKTIQTPGYGFLYPVIGSLSRWRRYILWCSIQITIYFPVLVYAGISAGVAAKMGLSGTAFLLLLFNILMCILPVAIYDRKLWRPELADFTGHFQQWLNRRWVRPFSLYYIFELLTNHTRMLLSTKVFSGAILLLTFMLMRTTVYDDRVVLCGVLLSCIIHTGVIFYHRFFEDQYLQFTRNLPMQLAQRYLQLSFTYFFLFLPEYLLIVVNTWRFAGVLPLLGILFFAHSLLLLFRCLMYFPRFNPDLHLRWALAVSFVVLFLVLGYWYLLTALVLQLVALWIFIRRYDKYEPLNAAII
ncbi:hypothetical protein CK934_11855 [Chitinophaga sp. MD30]|nr:hypothetical protein CK934_11855 [Chitinophaga sp. MD30]